jgi:hypothetical protein
VEGEFGVLRVEQLAGLIRPDNVHYVRTRLVCLENTHNRGGGRVQPYDEVERISSWAHANGLAMHLDGARLFNAAVASRIPAAQWARHFDTVSVCFSKGLGAPIGSALAGAAGVFNGLAYQQVWPYMGFVAGLYAFIAAVVGGIGNLPGAVLGGLLIGLAQSFSIGYISSTFSDAVVFAILIAVMLVRPSGLLGKAAVTKV